MESKAKEKALQSMDIKDKDDWIEVRAEAIYNAIDIALQEQAKEIKEMLEKYEKEILWNKAKNLLIFSNEWDQFWEKYGVKEEEGK